MNTLPVSNTNDSYHAVSMLPHRVMIEDSKGLRDVDIVTKQFADARLFLTGNITQTTAMDLVAAMTLLADEHRDVDIFINSPGGEVAAGLVIYDMIQSYPYQITMYCTGLAASMGALIFAGGQKGRRFILPHSRVMIHEPLIAGGMGGSATTIEKAAQDILDTKAVLNKLLAHHTGKTVDQINAATVSDNYMNAKEAIAFGLCDEIRSVYTQNTRTH